MTIKEFEELGLTEEDGKLYFKDGEWYFKYNVPVECVEFSITLNKED